MKKIQEMRVIKEDGHWCFELLDSEKLQPPISVWMENGDTDIDAIYNRLIGFDWQKEMMEDVCTDCDVMKNPNCDRCLGN
jgi:hypothetical protein